MQYSASHGRIFNQTEMADILDVPQPSLSQWEKGTRLPQPDSLDKIAKVFGPEAYRIAGVPARMPEDPNLQRIVNYWFDLSPALQKNFADAAETQATKQRDNLDELAVQTA